jgi:hypothetical protein
VLTGPLTRKGLTRSEDEAWPDGSWPREARLVDEEVCFGRKTQPGGVEARAQAEQGWCRETAKRRAVRIDGAGRPPEECQRYDRSPICLRLSALGCLSPGLNACATFRSNENSFAESAAATSRSTQ